MLSQRYSLEHVRSHLFACGTEPASWPSYDVLGALLPVPDMDLPSAIFQPGIWAFTGGTKRSLFLNQQLDGTANGDSMPLAFTHFQG
jgi:hypothetical protein